MHTSETMRYIYFLLVIIIWPLTFLGQSNYYTTDSVSYVGVELKDGGAKDNLQFFHVMKGSEIIRYTPYEVVEYGFNDGRIYVSKEVQLNGKTKRVFLEQLYLGNVSLYFYKDNEKKSFFLQKDSCSLIEIPKINENGTNYTEQLLSLTDDCSNVVDACRLVDYNKISFVELISRYNRCELKPFQFLNYGLFIGITQSKLKLNSETSDDVIPGSVFKNSNSFYAGLFIDFPLISTDFSVFTSLGLYKSSFSTNAMDSSIDVDLLINQTTFKVPIVIKYTLPLLKFRPYLNFGFNYSYNFKNESIIYKASVNDNVIQYETPIRKELISDNQFGYVCGLGLQYYLNYKRFLFMEIRYDNSYSVKTQNKFVKPSFDILTGINF